jgi:O-antigen/teichoic acid export membrane protein
VTLPTPGEATEGSSRPLARGALIASASRVVVAAAGAASTIVVARILGPRGWATCTVATSFSAVIYVGSTLGVEHGIAYYVSSKRWSARSAFASAMRVAAGVGCVGAAIGIAVRIAVPPAFAGLSLWLSAVVAGGVPFALACLYISFISYATDRYEAATAIPAAQAILTLGLGVAGAALYGVTGAITGGAIATAAVGLVSAKWGRRAFDDAAEGSSTRLRDAVSFGVKGYLGNALQMINYRLDLFILASVASRASVGQYGLAVAITMSMWLLPGALSDVLFPRIARLSVGEDAAPRELVEAKSLRHATLIVAATTTGLAGGFTLLVTPIFGQDFRPTERLGLILLPGSAAIGLAAVVSAIVVGRGKPSYGLYNSLLTVPLTIALYATLIPAYGATGAAVASSVSYVMNLVIFCWFYRRVKGMPVLRSFVPTSSELRDLRAIVEPLGAYFGKPERPPTRS